MLLQIKELNVFYDAIHALQGVSLEVNEGEVVTLIGANGAGKSTTLRTISGLVSARSGSITFEGQEILQSKAHDIVALGISHVPEGRRVFSQMQRPELVGLAVYGAGPVLRTMIRFFAVASRANKLRSFGTREEAIDWLMTR